MFKEALHLEAKGHYLPSIHKRKKITGRADTQMRKRKHFNVTATENHQATMINNEREKKEQWIYKTYKKIFLMARVSPHLTIKTLNINRLSYPLIRYKLDE